MCRPRYLRATANPERRSAHSLGHREILLSLPCAGYSIRRKAKTGIAVTNQYHRIEPDTYSSTRVAMDRKLTTIVAMDVVGYSRLMELDERGTLEQLKEIRAKIIEPTVAKYGGRTVKLMGDGALLEFSSVVGALQCAIHIQRELGARAGSTGHENTVRLRIGVHLGD